MDCNLSTELVNVSPSSPAHQCTRHRRRLINAATGATSVQIEVGTRKREALGHGRWRRRRLIEAEHLAAVIASEMYVCRVLAPGRDGEAENTVGIGALVRQAALDQPIEDAIEGDAIQC